MILLHVLIFAMLFVAALWPDECDCSECVPSTNRATDE